MSLYVDSSALLKRYVHEDDSSECERMLRADASWITGRHTWIEVLRNLARLLEGEDLARMEQAFHADWRRMHIVELERATCERAADFAKMYGARTLDALHLAAAHRVGGTTLPFVTFDLRQARAARALGFSVLGS